MSSISGPPDSAVVIETVVLLVHVQSLVPEVASPVKSIVAPAASAAAMTSASRCEPPGCTKAVTPAPAQTSTARETDRRRPTRKQRRAPAPVRLWPLRGGRCQRGSSVRHPCPRARDPRASTMAFDLTCRQTRHAKSRASRSSSVGARRVATLHVAGSSAATSAVRREERAAGAAELEHLPPAARRGRDRAPRACSAAAARMSSASGSTAGATTTSRKMRTNRSASAASMGTVMPRRRHRRSPDRRPAPAPRP